MAVRAKFRLNSVTIDVYDKNEQRDGKWVKVGNVERRTLNFTPVYGNGDPNHENTKFWDASPSGSLQLGCINPEAYSQFEIGKEYYLDFTPAE
jgi:hypothetical protein